MLGEGGAVALGDHVPGALQSRLGVPAHHVAGLAQVAARVELGRALRHGLPDIAHRLQGLVVDFDQLLGLLQHGLALGHHQADGVPHAAGAVPLGDHHVPVLLDVAHLVVGHVLGGEHRQHAGQGQGPGRVDVQHPGAGVLGAHGGGVDHALQLHVVHVLPAAQHLVPHVHAERALAHAVPVPLLQGGVRGSVAPQDGGGQGDALDDLLVAGAAADIAPDCLADLGLGGVGRLVDQGRTRHHHARDAEAALHGPHRAEGVDEGLLLPLRQALDGDDGLAHGPLGGQHAGLDRLVVHQDGAGAAGPLAAPVLDGGKVQVVPQVAQQGLFLLGGVQVTVDI